MASSSASEFLTFMRHVTVRSSRLAIRPSRPITQLRTSPRYLSTSTARLSSKIGEERDHAIDRAEKRGDTYDIQADNLDKARKGKAQGGVDNATGQTDSMSSTQKAKQDHPEAPDTVIGMQDERGGRGAGTK